MTQNRKSRPTLCVKMRTVSFLLYLLLAVGAASFRIAPLREAGSRLQIRMEGQQVGAGEGLKSLGFSGVSNAAGLGVGVALSVLLDPHGAVASAAGDLGVLPVARFGLDVFINTLSLLFLCRTVLSWYPKTDLNKLPYSIAAWPTEPLLVPVRSLIPPAFGVDVSSIVWVMLLSFLREILAGQQGILTLLERQ